MNVSGYCLLNFLGQVQLLNQWKITNKWDKVFKNGPSEICERQPLKNLK